MIPFETSAIQPGLLYQVKDRCAFGLGKPLLSGLVDTLQHMNGGELLLALGCYRKIMTRDEAFQYWGYGREEYTDCFYFKFLWNEDEVYLPLAYKKALEESSGEPHEMLQCRLQVFVRPLLKKSDVVTRNSV